MIPLSFSLANAIAIGFSSYVVLKFAAGKKSDISLGAWFLFVIFLLKFKVLDLKSLNLLHKLLTPLKSRCKCYNETTSKLKGINN